MKKNEAPIIISEVFPVTPDKVWDAITQPSKMRQWFFGNIPAFRPEVDFTTQFNVKAETRTFLHQWEVIEVVPYRKLVINWKYGGYSGDSNVIIELSPSEKGAELKLTHQTLEDFPQDIPEFATQSCIQGWNFFIRKNLKQYLHKQGN